MLTVRKNIIAISGNTNFMLATNLFSSHDERTAGLFREKNKPKVDITNSFYDACLRALELAREISRWLALSFLRLREQLNYTTW